MIVTSATYRQSSQPERNPDTDVAVKTDPGIRLLWHTRVRRRDAESIRDTVLQVSGQLSLRMDGVSANPLLPGPPQESRYSWDAERPRDRNRRTIYVLARRNLAYPLLAAFDLPDRQIAARFGRHGHRDAGPGDAQRRVQPDTGPLSGWHAPGFELRGPARLSSARRQCLRPGAPDSGQIAAAVRFLEQEAKG